MKKYVIGIALILSTMLTQSLWKTPYVQAQNPPEAGECMADVYRWASHEQRIYRSVLFGKKEAEDERIGTVRYSKDGDTWMKTGDSEWKSLAPGFESTTWTDAIWSSQDESDRITGVSVRRGLFEMKQLLSSELVPSVTQSIRALQCRLKSICLAASDSMQKDVPSSISVQPQGCLELTYPRFEGCLYDEGSPTQAVEAEVRRECEAVTRALLVREMDLAKLVVSYDAGYRTLLQFAGIFEQYLTEFRFPLVKPLWEAAQLIGTLHRIPCFISECNE